MTIFDIGVIAAGILFGWTGFRRGLIRTVFGVIGLVAGASAAVVFLPRVLEYFDLSEIPFRPYLGLSVLVFGASLGAFIMGKIASVIRGVLFPFPFLKFFDALAGLAVALAAVLVTTWILASALLDVRSETFAKQVENSLIYKQLEENLPEQFKRFPEFIQGAINASPLPSVFSNLIQAVDTAAPEVTPIPTPDLVLTATKSVVKIDGIAESCNAAMTGTGFLVGPERVITNAHVVAGVSEPYVSFAESNSSYQGRVVAIDRETDAAILYVPGLVGKPLSFIGPVEINDPSFIAGFPGGRGLSITNAVVAANFAASGKDIDSQKEVIREVIVFGGKVSAGNSGGPLLSMDGQVYGVIFAADAVHANTGYALAPSEVAPMISAASTKVESVDTGDCVTTD
jgi:S1-C subfamily serine protease